ncbi:MAG: hypothetical protein ACOYNL_07030 [Rickettsiales bacterium]
MHIHQRKLLALARIAGLQGRRQAAPTSVELNALGMRINALADDFRAEDMHAECLLDRCIRLGYNDLLAGLHHENTINDLPATWEELGERFHSK